jgi:DNA polymerase-3 subunit alpha
MYFTKSYFSFKYGTHHPRQHQFHLRRLGFRRLLRKKEHQTYPRRRDPQTPGSLLQHERIGVLPGEVNKLLKEPLKAFPDKWIIRQPVTFQNKTYYNLHRLLRAMDKNTLLTKLQPEDVAGEKEYFIPQVEMLTAFRQYPFIITNTYRLLDACSITMRFGEDKNKKIYSASR